MKKQWIVLLAVVMLGTALYANGSNEAQDKASTNTADTLTLYTVNSTDPDFQDWLTRAQDATGLKINAIAAPTDSDTRQQKITTMLSTGDSGIDIIEINDEMSTAFKNTGWLEPLNATVMTDTVLADMAAPGYITDMLTNHEGQIIGVPTYQGYLALWVNQQILDEIGMQPIKSKDDLMTFFAKSSGNGRYGYGGSWEKTYVFNEIAEFVNLFGGDFFDWSQEGNKEALQFMKSLVTKGYTPIDQIADKYEQMNQKFIDGMYGCVFMWGTGYDFKAAGMLGPDKIHQIAIPPFKGNKASIFTDSWSFVENKASKHKEACTKFLAWAASIDGYHAGWDDFDRYPASKSAANTIIPEDNWVKQAYASYAADCNVHGRPMLPKTMEYITDIGTIFQEYMQDKISLDTFCTKAQKYVEECK